MQIGELRRPTAFNPGQLGSRALPGDGLSKRKTMVVGEAQARLIGCGFGGVDEVLRKAKGLVVQLGGGFLGILCVALKLLDLPQYECASGKKSKPANWASVPHSLFSISLFSLNPTSKHQKNISNIMGDPEEVSKISEKHKQFLDEGIPK